MIKIKLRKYIKKGIDKVRKERKIKKDKETAVRSLGNWKRQ